MNLNIKHTRGAGLFAQIKFLVQKLYLNEDKIITVDFSDPYFPYKDSDDTCEFYKILTINNNVKLDDELKIFDKNFKDNRLFNNFIFYSQDLVSSEYKFEPIFQFRAQNNNLKKKYLQKLNNIFFKYININNNILIEVENYYNNFMSNNYILGIHYRAHTLHNDERYGTFELNFNEKINNVFFKIDNILKDKKDYKIYLATDVKSIQNKFINKYKNNLLFNKNNTSMSNEASGCNEPHFGFALQNKNNTDSEEFFDNFKKTKPGLNGGIQLMIDSLILSKCNFFIPSNSCLSDLVLIFNPNIEYSYVTE